MIDIEFRNVIKETIVEILTIEFVSDLRQVDGYQRALTGYQNLPMLHMPGGV
jgi:hypothetical protein